MRKRCGVTLYESPILKRYAKLFVNTSFHKLTKGWNAEPNSPDPKIELDGKTLPLLFYMNLYQFEEYDEDDVGEITFTNCSRYRLGTLNDEGWYRGQSRFVDIAHSWGEFYEIKGDPRMDYTSNDWQIVEHGETDHSHYLFYFRDEDFECCAESWSLRILKA